MFICVDVLICALKCVYMCECIDLCVQVHMCEYILCVDNYAQLCMCVDVLICAIKCVCMCVDVFICACPEQPATWRKERSLMCETVIVTLALVSF